MKKKVDVRDLKPGMYVSELDRPWIETPFLFQGFPIQSQSDVEELRRYCEYVLIDLNLSSVAPPRAANPAELQAEFDMLKHNALPRRKPNAYQDRATLEQELPQAREFFGNSKVLIQTIMEDVRLGHALDTQGAKRAVRGLAESVLRNPDALICLSQLKNADEYTALHSVRVCILALAFGRHLGLEEPELHHLGLGALLHDIGKMRVPLDILNKPDRLTEAEFEIIKTHAPEGARILDEHHIPADVVDIALSHHERYDGRGYMRGLKANQIRRGAVIASIVDCYDAITSDRAYRGAISSHAALKKMYTWRRTDFDETLVEQFIQCMGIYPIGSLVELNTGHVGVVMTINRMRYLRPKLVLVLKEDKTRYGALRVVDLMTHTRDDLGKPWEIKAVLEPGTHGINPADYLPAKLA